MHKALNQVREFHLAFGVPVAPKPRFPDKARRMLRIKLLKEEFEEYLDAEGAVFDGQGNLIDVGEGDLTEVADALADVKVIALGTELEYGIPADRVFEAVHSSNMEKLGPDGKPIYREDGKVIKAPGWKAPDIKSILEAVNGD
jgi:predicted HAD superfamily Cof-like phosphohydrolase